MPEISINLIDIQSDHHMPDFSHKVLNFNKSSFFDLPSSARLLIGLMKGFNTFTKNSAFSSFIQLDHQREAATFAFNCNQTYVDILKNEKHITSSSLEVSVGQNIFEFLIPKWRNTNVKDAMLYWLEYFDELEFKDVIFKYIGDKELENGVLNVFTDDMQVLDGVDLSKMKANGINRILNYEHWDPINFQKVEQINTTNTVFVSY